MWAFIRMLSPHCSCIPPGPPLHHFMMYDLYSNHRSPQIGEFLGSTVLYHVTDDLAALLPSKLYLGSYSGIYTSTLSSSWSFAPQFQVSYPKCTRVGRICTNTAERRGETAQGEPQRLVFGGCRYPLGS